MEPHASVDDGPCTAGEAENTGLGSICDSAASVVFGLHHMVRKLGTAGDGTCVLPMAIDLGVDSMLLGKIGE